MHAVLRVLLVVLHDAPLHLVVLVRHELVAGQVGVVGVVLGDVVAALGLHNVAGHEGGGVVVALQVAVGEVSLHLETEQVAGVLLLQLAGVGRVELDAEVEQRVDQRQSKLTRHWLLQVQPILGNNETG